MSCLPPLEWIKNKKLKLTNKHNSMEKKYLLLIQSQLSKNNQPYLRGTIFSHNNMIGIKGLITDKTASVPVPPEYLNILPPNQFLIRLTHEKITSLFKNWKKTPPQLKNQEETFFGSVEARKSIKNNKPYLWITIFKESINTDTNTKQLEKIDEGLVFFNHLILTYPYELSEEYAENLITNWQNWQKEHAHKNPYYENYNQNDDEYHIDDDDDDDDDYNYNLKMPDIWDAFDADPGDFGGDIDNLLAFYGRD